MSLKNRRKKVIIHNLQIQLIISIAGLIIGTSLILVTSLFLIFRNNMAAIGISKEFISEILYDSVLPVAVIALVVFVVSIWAIVLITHKIYGPLYRLRTYIKKLCEGETTDELQFRRGDAINGLKEIYNDLRKSMEKTLHYDYNTMVEIFSEIEEILDKIYYKRIKDREIYDQLQDTCGRLAKALDITSEAIEK